MSTIFKDTYRVNFKENIKKPEDAELIFVIIQETLKKFKLDLIKGMKVLEIGSGNATLLDLLKKHGVDILGVDAEPRPSKNENKIPLSISGYIENLPFSNNSFNIIIANAVFDPTLHNQDQRLMMTEIARVLKPGGMFFGFKQSYLLDVPIDGFNLIPDETIVIYKKS